VVDAVHRRGVRAPVSAPPPTDEYATVTTALMSASKKSDVRYNGMLFNAYRHTFTRRTRPLTSCARNSLQMFVLATYATQFILKPFLKPFVNPDCGRRNHGARRRLGTGLLLLSLLI
jgi:hypothetical protein